MPAYNGTRHHNAKLDNRKVRQARKSFDTGKWTVTALATKYGVSWGTMYALLKRQTWKHVA
ncbi:hypothetical protein C6N75_09655 [Streptomyces solincola]|uniref:Uncharacterized protein n=1 Tax=Streptomyces solincola TaxID=2100817 RepID=A0A2S9PY48_9ACTN|nr:hypothetical protein [Streptomyces solincola]PRH79340.1 hypothetical protein C6N75_09655 [Streptomyces solincola]